MKTVDEIRNIVRLCEFNDWDFHVGLDDTRPYLQVRFSAACSKTGDGAGWSGRKWFISPHMVKSEIVQTAFKAVLTALEHEARESFQYRGRSIFGPHFDVDRLWEMATDDNEETRHPRQGPAQHEPFGGAFAGAGLSPLCRA